MSRSIGVIVACILGLGAADPVSTLAYTLQPQPGPTATSPPVSDLLFEKRLAALDAAMAKTTDFQANFEQSKFTPLLKKPLVSSGVLTSKGRLVRWETTTPCSVILLIEPANKPSLNSEVDGKRAGKSVTPALPGSAASTGEMRVYYPADRLCEIYPIGGALSDFAGAPLPRLAELRERFTLSPLRVSELGGDGDNPSLVGLLLCPRSEELRRHLGSIKILIDESIPSATKLVITDADGEHTEITLTSIHTNTGLKDTDIQLTLPEDVRISRPLGTSASSPQRPSAPDTENPASAPR